MDDESDTVLFELIDDRGVTAGIFRSATEATDRMRPGWTVRESGTYVHQRADCGPVKVA